ncbi:MAG: LysE family transporter [Bauldia sp.]|nr:LysE family transporter [Bauldia sp.]
MADPVPGTIHVLGPLAAVWALAVILPGPNFLVIVWTGATGGRRPALLAAAGVVTGAAFWIAAGLLGMKALFAALPFAGTTIKLAGALYLVWFGIQMMIRADAAPATEGPRRGLAPYRAGLATTLANPKSAAVAASLLAVALPAGASVWLVGAAFGVLISISAAWYVTVAIVGSMPVVVDRFTVMRRQLSRGIGALFTLFGLRLALNS